VTTLAQFRPGDERVLIELFTSETVRRYLGGPVDGATARTKIESIFNSENDLPAWVIVEPNVAERCVMGYVILSRHHDGLDIEISYALLPSYQGQGIALKAVLDALAYAFEALKLPRVLAETQTKNLQSISLLERIGMRFLKRVDRFGDTQNIYGLDRKVG
jgi:[ribosomal protein S5]-alanine N-acetyltransferase